MTASESRLGDMRIVEYKGNVSVVFTRLGVNNPCVSWMRGVPVINADESSEVVYTSETLLRRGPNQLRTGHMTPEDRDKIFFARREVTARLAKITV